MIDIENYKRAVEWLQCGLAEPAREPEDQTVRLSVLHRFKVTYNVSESLLRQAYISLSDKDKVASLSTREVIRQASEEGLTLSSPMQWMQYGVSIESMKEALMPSTDEERIALSSVSLPEFALELESFAHNLESRLAAHV